MKPESTEAKQLIMDIVDSRVAASREEQLALLQGLINHALDEGDTEKAQETFVLLNNENPVLDAQVASFEIGKYEVTFDAWDNCVDQGGCKQSLEDKGWGRGRRPAINVSWHDAQEYVLWLSSKTAKQYRLPTEAEWEYAARAGTADSYSFSGKISVDKANYDSKW